MTKYSRPSIRQKSLTCIYQVILAKDRTLDISSLEPALLHHALELGFGPLLRLYGQLDKASASSRSLVKAADLSAKVLTGNQLDALEDIASAAGNLTKDITLLKGMSVALQYYPEPYMRTMGDIDILVNNSRQEELENICIELGYVPKSNLAQTFYIDHHHSMPLFNASNNVWVEIHASLFPKKETIYSDRVFALQNVIKQQIPFSAGTISANRLVVELELLYICAHWALELSWQKSGIRLLDILFILDNENLDWIQIFHWLEKSPITARAFYILLTVVKEEHLGDLPNERLSEVANYTKGMSSINRRILIHFIRKHLLLGEKFGVLLSRNNVGIIWNELIFGRFHPAIALFVVVPYRLLFPPNAGGSYSMKFQLSRIKNMFSRI